MLCKDCQSFIQEIDRLSETSVHEHTPKREVCTQDFRRSLDQKCYLCARLLVQLGDEKWQHILNELPKTNLVVFEKSVQIFDTPFTPLIRLGCRVTPILQSNTNGEPVALDEGKRYSYGYLQFSLLVQSKRFESLLSRYLQCTGYI